MLTAKLCLIRCIDKEKKYGLNIVISKESNNIFLLQSVRFPNLQIALTKKKYSITVVRNLKKLSLELIKLLTTHSYIPYAHSLGFFKLFIYETKSKWPLSLKLVIYLIRSFSAILVELIWARKQIDIPIKNIIEFFLEETSSKEKVMIIASNMTDTGLNKNTMNNATNSKIIFKIAAF